MCTAHTCHELVTSWELCPSYLIIVFPFGSNFQPMSGCVCEFSVVGVVHDPERRCDCKVTVCSDFSRVLPCPPQSAHSGGFSSFSEARRLRLAFALNPLPFLLTYRLIGSAERPRCP